MRFSKLTWRNLFSYGDYDSEVRLDQDGIVFVRGVNRDDNTSNGSGKSSIVDIFVWTLFGKPMKNIPADNVKNSHTKGEGHACLEFWVDQDYYELHRYRGSREHGNGVVVYKNNVLDEDFSNGTNRDVQKRIDALLRLDYHSLTSSIIFTSEVPFLFPKLTAEKRRAHLEQMLGMQAYSIYGKVAAKRTRGLKRLLEDITIEEREKKNYLSTERDDLRNYTDMFKSFSTDKDKEIAELKSQLEQVESDIAAIDLSERDTVVENLRTVQSEQDHTLNAINELKRKEIELQSDRKSISSQIASEEKSHTALIKSATKAHDAEVKLLQGKIDLMKDECPTCERGWDHSECEELTAKYEAMILQAKAVFEEQVGVATEQFNGMVSGLQEQVEKLANDLNKIAAELKEKNDSLKGFMESEALFKKRLTSLPTEETLKNLQEKRERIAQSIEDKSKESNPYKEVIDNLEIKITDYLDSLDKLDDSKGETEEQMRYATFWDESFNNDGLKLFIFENVVPILNSRIGFYLPILFDGKPYALTFDKMMNMTVTANAKPISYGGLSQGERKRVDLAIALALLDTAQAQHGVISNVMFFDEIFDSSLDSQGVRTVTEILHSMPVETMFIMSHRLEIADEFDNVLDVEKNGKLSKVLA